MAQTIRPPQVPSPFVEPWKPTQRFIIVAALIVALVATISTASFVVQRIWFTPESVVEGYFKALSDRDAAKAVSYLDSKGTTIDGLLSSDQYVPPTALKVEGVEKGDDSKTRIAKVKFKIGENEASGELTLRAKDGLEFGLFRGWTIDSTRPALQVSTSTPIAVRVNGKALPADENGQGSQLELFPGRYVVDSEESPLTASDPVTVDATFDDRDVDLETHIKPEAKTAVDGQIKSYLTACLTKATKSDEGCPFSSYTELTNPVWRIVKYPATELRMTDDGSVYVQTTSDGQATVTGTQYGGYPYTNTQEFNVDGTVAVHDGKIVYTPGE